MDYRPLDITVISASGLKNINLFTKMRVYVVVSLINGNLVSTKKTHVSNGGCNPTWSHRIKFSIKDSAIPTTTLLFVLRCRSLLGDKDIGEVSIPVSDLLNTTNGFDNTEHVVDYLVRRFIQGKARGTLTFSHQFRQKVPAIKDSGSPEAGSEDSVTNASYSPGMAYMTPPQGMSPYSNPSYPPPPQACGGYMPYAGAGGGWYPHAQMGVYPYPQPHMGCGQNQQIIQPQQQQPTEIKG